METYDLIIIGAGPAGLTAAIYSLRYNLKTLVIGEVVGGQVAEVGAVENYPGFESSSGLELAKKWYEHAKKLGAEILVEGVDEVTPRVIASGPVIANAVKQSPAGIAAVASGDLAMTTNTFKVVTRSGKEFLSKTIILASGTEPRRLNVPGEKEFCGKGVSYCFTCDAPFFKGKAVAVVGGGDSAFVGALMLSGIAKKVYLIHRREEFTAKPGFVAELKKKVNVELVLDATAERIEGKEVVEGVTLRVIASPKGAAIPTEIASSSLDRLGTSRNDEATGTQKLKVDGVFIEIGSMPSTKLPKQLNLKITQTGFVEVAPDQSTNVPGIYAAGDLTTESNGVRQIVCAMSEGAIAAQSVFKWLRGSGMRVGH